MPDRPRFQEWLDNTALHHRWIANGPFWFLCPPCRDVWGDDHPGFWTQFRHALTPTGRAWRG